MATGFNLADWQNSANVAPTTTVKKATATNPTPRPTTQYSAPIGPGLDAQGNSTLPTTSTDGTGGGTGGGSYGGTTTVVPQMTDEEYLAADATFQAQKAALEAALTSYVADLTAQKERYQTDYGTSLRKLGFSGDDKVLDTAKWDPTDARWEDPSGSAIGGLNWNETDQTTASGRAFMNALNDYAARGMLQSSAYGRARNDLSRSLNEQLSSTATARNNAMADYLRQETDKKRETEVAKATASQEALARIKAGYGITG